MGASIRARSPEIKALRCGVLELDRRIAPAHDTNAARRAGADTNMAHAQTLVVLTLAPMFAPQDARLAPAPGTIVLRVVESSSSSTLDSWSARSAGQPVPSHFLPELEMTTTDSMRLEMADEYLACERGAASKLRRSYRRLVAEQLEQLSMNGQQMMSELRKGKSPVEGCTVSFDAHADKERVLEEGECAADIVDALELDLDLTAFLPRDAKLDAWTVPATGLNPWAERFGAIPFEYSPAPEEAHFDAGQLAPNAQGEWRVRRAGARKDGETNVLVFALQGEFKSHGAIEAELQHVPIAQGMATERSETTAKLEGELLWNVDRNVLHGLELEGTSTMVHTTTSHQESGPGVPAYEQVMNFSGTLEATWTVRIGP
jgi:hypothetical protein